jgi:hypothetical protein
VVVADVPHDSGLYDVEAEVAAFKYSLFVFDWIVPPAME